MKSYHFDLGDSTDGPVGLCARVEARSKAEAVALLRDLLPEELPVATGHPRVDYVNVYINTDAITETAIDQVDSGDEGD